MNGPAFIRRLSDAEVAELAARAPEGPLSGVTFAIKDNIDLAGIPTTVGCPALSTPAESSATAVQRLLDAGAVPVGKTNLDQFATGLVGTRSPYGAPSAVGHPEHISGGSSSGSAVAVASGTVPLALGTDTAGSGRVPAAFNGLVGVKPTRGIIPTTGVFPACRSLDCVTTLTRTVAAARAALDVLVGDDGDAWSRAVPPALPLAVPARMQVVAVPDGELELDPEHQQAWDKAVAHLATVVPHVVRIDVTPFLTAARLLYEGPWLAERWAAFGHLLDPAVDGVDPTVRTIVSRGRDLPAADVFRGFDRLAALTRQSAPTWSDVDALMLPVTPGHPTHAEVAADPLGANARMGTFTNFVNLMDLCAVAVPAGARDDGLPFGVQLVAPAFADAPLLDLASRWCGEPVADVEPRALVAVVGAHLTGLPLNRQLVGLGGRLHARTRTDGGYRMFRLPGAPARPALTRTGDGRAGGFPLELWDLPAQSVGQLAAAIPAPLGLGRVVLHDGSEVLGFICADGGADGAVDITDDGGWRAHLQRPR
ncbi:MAG TPA: allophanate hydrolase [Mycobacteriales bacterium]|nr:allophanate hydrolase [Mycobacteriales bacterium]